MINSLSFLSQIHPKGTNEKRKIELQGCLEGGCSSDLINSSFALISEIHTPILNVYPSHY